MRSPMHLAPSLWSVVSGWEERFYWRPFSLSSESASLPIR
ncbi:UNVERIFIED_CONTAM: hypothetical protein GTU68_013000 [Idotea baltica]|nr:hypothetical protein [Idotea baltica]